MTQETVKRFIVKKSSILKIQLSVKYQRATLCLVGAKSICVFFAFRLNNCFFSVTRMFQSEEAITWLEGKAIEIQTKIIRLHSVCTSS